MMFAENLYVGDGAAEIKKDIIEKIGTGRQPSGVYALILPENNYDTLDIFPASVLNQKYYKRSGKVIVGIAKGKDEAMSLMQKIIMDCINVLGRIDLPEYFNRK